MPSKTKPEQPSCAQYDALLALRKAQELVDALERQADAVAEMGKHSRSQSEHAPTLEERRAAWTSAEAAVREGEFLAGEIARAKAQFEAAKQHAAALDVADPERVFSDASRVAVSAGRALQSAAVKHANAVEQLVRSQAELELAADDRDAARNRCWDLAAALLLAPPPLHAADGLSLATVWVRGELYRRGVKSGRHRPYLLAPSPQDAGAGPTLDAVRNLLGAPFSPALNAVASPAEQLSMLLRLDGSYEDRVRELDAQQQAQVAAGRAYAEARDRARAEERSADDEDEDD